MLVHRSQQIAPPTSAKRSKQKHRLFELTTAQLVTKRLSSSTAIIYYIYIYMCVYIYMTKKVNDIMKDLGYISELWTAIIIQLAFTHTHTHTHTHKQKGRLVWFNYLNLTQTSIIKRENENLLITIMNPTSQTRSLLSNLNPLLTTTMYIQPSLL